MHGQSVRTPTTNARTLLGREEAPSRGSANADLRRPVGGVFAAFSRRYVSAPPPAARPVACLAPRRRNDAVGDPLSWWYASPHEHPGRHVSRLRCYRPNTRVKWAEPLTSNEHSLYRRVGRRLRSPIRTKPIKSSAADEGSGMRNIVIVPWPSNQVIRSILFLPTVLK
jgi:hypothetical protein